MLSCNICYQNFEKDTDKEPKIMECGETLCLNCIKNIKKDKDHFTCPICQKDIYENIEDMPTNLYIFNPVKTILCDICSMEYDNNYKSEKTPRILQCGHTFCSKCLKSKENLDKGILCMFCGQFTKKKVEDCRVNKIIIEKVEEEIISSMKYIEGNIDISKIDNQYSVGLMGETGGGKTSINQFFRTGKPLDNSLATVGFNYEYKFIKCQKKTVKLSLIDTAGQEKFMSLSAGALRGVYGLLLVFSLTPLWQNNENYEKADEATKKNLEEGYKLKVFQGLEFWLNQFKAFNTKENAIIYLIGNKVDDEEHRIIKYKDAKNFAKQYNLKYYETSAKTGQNINRVFFDLTYDLLKTFPNIIGKGSTIQLNNGKKNSGDGSCC